MKKARKVLVFLMVLTFTLSLSLSAFAASDKSGKGQAKGKAKHSTESTIVSEPTATEPVTTETPAPPAWTVKKANKNLVQFQSTDKKGGKIVIPLQAMKSHGIEAVWDKDEQTVTLSGTNGKSILIGINGITSTLTQVAAISLESPNFNDLTFENNVVSGPISGTIGGEVTGALTGTVSGSVDPVSRALSGKFTGYIFDPLKGMINLSGTLGGTDTNPQIILDAQIADSDKLAFTDIATQGHAYVPFKWLSAYFGTAAVEETAADTAALTVEPSTDNTDDTLISDDDSEVDESSDTEDESEDADEESELDETPAE